MTARLPQAVLHTVRNITVLNPGIYRDNRDARLSRAQRLMQGRTRVLPARQGTNIRRMRDGSPMSRTSILGIPSKERRLLAVRHWRDDRQPRGWCQRCPRGEPGSLETAPSATQSHGCPRSGIALGAAQSFSVDCRRFQLVSRGRRPQVLDRSLGFIRPGPGPPPAASPPRPLAVLSLDPPGLGDPAPNSAGWIR